MKHKLININTKEEHLCDKVTMDGFDYYVSDEAPKLNDVLITAVGNIHYIKEDAKDVIEYVSKLGKKVIATTNPNIDVPKVVDEIEKLSVINVPNRKIKTPFGNSQDITPKRERKCFIKGYNKSQETHPFSEEDLKSILDFITNEKTIYAIMYGDQEKRFATIDKDFTIEQILDIWKEQQSKAIYYNE